MYPRAQSFAYITEAKKWRKKYHASVLRVKNEEGGKEEQVGLNTWALS